ncbi:MAG: hypothetical protein Q7U38_15640 [Methylobacter sp.]|nr:hypothetical protein [Methylobacter sp.]MDP2098697.1 hypothetical protein [Methylobacter sp.]MDP2427725.1 hypothetical protein [Methylobacter sp.]MDP3054917.1 hypothetical protein [Methylobacter sp.]MDP3364138.1 hypothetical protein [Methylobacter sp.]
MAIQHISITPGTAMAYNQLPPKQTDTKVYKDRIYRTALRSDLFLKLEKESQERGLTPYKLTQIITSMYIEGGLVVPDDLNTDPESSDSEVSE